MTFLFFSPCSTGALLPECVFQTWAGSRVQDNYSWESTFRSITAVTQIEPSIVSIIRNTQTWTLTLCVTLFCAWLLYKQDCTGVPNGTFLLTFVDKTDGKQFGDGQKCQFISRFNGAENDTAVHGEAETLLKWWICSVC